VEGLKAPDPRHRPLDPEVIALDPLLQGLGDVMDRHTRQEPVLPGRRNGGRIGARAVRADPVRREQRLVLQRLAEEALGRTEIAVGCQQEVDRRAVLVEGPVEIAPLAPDLDVDPMGTGYRLGSLRATISGSATRACRKLWKWPRKWLDRIGPSEGNPAGKPCPSARFSAC
jgi:hypothetical protein